MNRAEQIIDGLDRDEEEEIMALPDLIRKVNVALGQEALRRLDDMLTTDEFNKLQALFARGCVGLHADHMFGITAVEDNVWTSEGFER